MSQNTSALKLTRVTIRTNVKSGLAPVNTSLCTLLCTLGCPK